VAKTPPAPLPGDEQNTAPNAGKGRPTPTRAEQEAARKRPLVPDTKEAKAKARADLNAQRERARAGMAAGEDKYLPARDKGPQRRFVRDYVDGGWHLAEWIMPLMILVILVSFVGIPALQYYSFFALWGFVIVAIADMIITGQLAKRAVKRKFGEDKVERGTAWYAGMRTMQMRFMRLPKPQVKRGTKVV